MSIDRNPADSTESDLAFAEQALRYQDGSLTSVELMAFEAVLAARPDRLREFSELQLQSAAIHGLFQQHAYDRPEPTVPQQRGRLGNLNAWGWPVAAMVLLSWGMWWSTFSEQSVAVDPATPVPDESTTEHDVRLAGASQAAFFGELVPQINALFERQRDYVLTGGLVELSFPTGASAIIEAPAIFRILDREGLALDAGRCSVHAPEGAEGFRLETPLTRVVDRGTRFSVKVSENSETEVQVVEGLADVYRKSEGHLLQETHTTHPEQPTASELPLTVRLADKEARRFAGSESATTESLPFALDRYRRQLPDRIVRYDSTKDERGAAKLLQSVTVQRGGVLRTYSAEELIPVSVEWFKSTETTDPNGHLTGGVELPSSRRSLLSDWHLNSGLINPGGQPQPLTTDPVMPESGVGGTPGMAVRFARPVMNGPGPDVVFFELQTMTNPPGGDAFHVSPLAFEPHLHSLTVTTYDLTLSSPEALPLSGFYLYRFESPVESLAALEARNCARTHVRLGFRGLATGIDLSDLGYREGDQVDGLFIQDAEDDTHRVDPTLIGGFPAEAIRTLSN